MKKWIAVRSSYWFVPSLMALGAAVLAAFMVWLDVRTGGDFLERHIGWYQSIKPSGARDVLSTIAGSMITVTGVVFSITIVAISFASGQYGPRLLTNFMSDRGNTITLGTFIATFVYCLLVLRTIREGTEGGGYVPQLAVTVGILLAMCSIGVLIYFVHHVPRSIHVNNVVAGIGKQLMRDIGKRFPQGLGEPAKRVPSAEEPKPQGPPCPIPSPTVGYIQRIEDDDLIEYAARHDLILKLRYRPGDFVTRHRPLVDAWPRKAVDEAAAQAIAGTFAIGNERTPDSDLRFLINELVEISALALSSGVNDPMTAVSCIDWLGAALEELSGRTMPSPLRADRRGAVRVIAPADRFESFVHLALGRLREYAAGDPITALRVLRTLGEVAAECPSRERIDTLEKERRKLLAMAREKLSGPSLEEVEDRAERLREMLSSNPGKIDEREADWLGGSV